MILDVHASFGHWPFQALEADTAARLAALLARTGISKALVSPVDAVLRPAPDDANARLFRALRGHRRLIPVPVLNPTLPQWPGVFREHAGRFPAVKVYPNYHGYSPADKRLGALMAELRRRRLVLLLPLRIEDERSQYPLMKVPGVPVDEVVRLARAFPHVPIACCCPSTDEAIALLKGASSIHVDISYADGPDPVRTLAAAGKTFARRILFGSHAPFLYAASAVLKVTESDVSPADKRGILSGNARRVFRLGS